MKKRILKQEFLFHGFHLNDKKRFAKNFGDLELSIDLDANWFGTVYMINIYYDYKKELPFEQKLMADIWAKCELMMNGSGSGLEIGALDTRWICGIIQDKDKLKDIHADAIIQYCKQFADIIAPIIAEHEI